MEIQSDLADTPSLNTFDQWARHPNRRIREAGAKLCARWANAGASHPQLRPLSSFILRAMSEGWPDPATAGAALYDLGQLAQFISKLEKRVEFAERTAAQLENQLWGGA